MKEQKEYLKKLWDKMELNSVYKPIGNNFFIIYDKNTSDKITEDGKKYIQLVEEQTKNL
jgi:hypothetical protein